MILKCEDFVGWRINWSDKAGNILELVKELNLGTESVIFIDDNPIERGRIREALPEVLVPEWPKDKMLYKQSLLSLNCFNTPSINLEDSGRTKMYQTESRRREFKQKFESLDAWLKTLETKVIVEEINETNRPRVAQLFNKTNQMNLTTRRLNEAELTEWIEEKNRRLWTFRVSDKFGDSGLTGIIGIECNGSEIQITDFLLSCRVMGRKIEETMLHIACEYGRALNLKTLTARYFKTKKNKPCRIFWEQSGFEHEPKTDTFTWNLDILYPQPDCISIEKRKNL